MEPHTPLHRARTIRVATSNSVILDVDLGFGVHIHRRAVLEGVRQQDIPYRFREEARHCLVVLLAKKKLLVQFVDERPQADPAIARIYLNERVHGNPEGLCNLASEDEPCLEISAFFLSLRRNRFDIEQVKAVLNGAKH